MLDLTFRVGDIITVLGYLGGGALIFFGLRQEVKLLAQRLQFLEDTVEKATDDQNKKIDAQSTEINELGKLLIKMVRYEERMLHQDEHILTMKREIEGLKNGQGWINGPRLANAGAGGSGVIP